MGVLGILGQDAATALIPSNIDGVDVRDPRPIVSRYVRMLRNDVDLVVVLAHQGKTAPMQTDDEARPDVQRDIVADIALAGSVDGIDVLLGGHADAGTRDPVVHPETGTLIMQTFGQGQHLGFLQLVINTNSGEIESYDGRLITVDSDALLPHPIVQQKIDGYRADYKHIYKKVGYSAMRLNRQYNQESDLGNLFADIVRTETKSVIGLIPSGGLRKDLPQGDVRIVDLLNAFPFTDNVAIVELSGQTMLNVLEQGLSLERGMLQVSGIEVRYDLSRPIGERVESVLVAGAPRLKTMPWRPLMMAFY